MNPKTERPAQALGEPKAGQKQIKKRDNQSNNQPDYTRRYAAELKKFATKYPYLVRHMVSGGTHERS